MKKSNWAFYIIAAVISLFLLGLWFYHGFNHVDSPLDPVLTMIWFAIMIMTGIVIHKIEKTRREKLRRIYLFEDGLFNPEIGTVLFHSKDDKIEEIRKVIESLEYPVSVDETAPNKPYTLRISTDKITRDKWTGSVSKPHSGNQAMSFNTQEELRSILRENAI